MEDLRLLGADRRWADGYRDPGGRPTLTSIDAALAPNTKDGYLYFLAKGDGSGTTAFAKTYKEHQANIKKYLKPSPSPS